jgi:hypothetical protein
MITNSTFNTYTDYLETFNSKDIVEIMNNNSSLKLKEEIFPFIGIDIDSDFKKFVSIKCLECHITVGFLISEDNNIILINTI